MLLAGNDSVNAKESMTAMPLDFRNKLRIAIFSGNYNYVMDGPVRALNKLVKYLEHQGHEVLVFAPTSSKPAFQHAGTLVSIPSASFPGKRSEYRFGFGLWGQAKKQLDAFAPTLIHIAAPDLTGYQALRYGEKNAIPVVASFHTRFDTYPRYYNMTWAEQYLTRYMRNFYNRCVQVYAPSQSMRDELLSEGIGRDIRIWSRGVDSTLFNPDKRDFSWRRGAGILDDDVAVTFVGRLVLEKGIDLFASAFQKAHKQNPSLKALIVGDGPERTHFEQLLPDGVFTGLLDGDDLAKAYASGDIFFNPSVTETFGNVTLEAMASGLPVIGAAATGSKSLIENANTGYVAEPTADSFADTLQDLVRNPDSRRTFGENARAKAEQYSWDTILEELTEHYYEAVGRDAVPVTNQAFAS